MAKQYTRINWQNQVTPLNDTNLNIMDKAIDENSSQLAEITSISRFPRIIPEADDTGRLQRAINSVGASKKKLQLAAETYIISDRLYYETDDLLGNAYIRNGIEIEGAIGTIIKASSTFPIGVAMLDLDGNPTGSSDNLNPRAQVGNTIKNIVFDGDNRASMGIRQRGNVNFILENIDVTNIAGGNYDASIYVAGTKLAGKDDADTNLRGVYCNVRVNKSEGNGYLATDNRMGTITFDDCSFEFCKYDGMKIACAGLTLNNCVFASNGIDGVGTGGLSIVKPATGSRNRGLIINGGTFEANAYHDINIEYCYGYSMHGATIHPYQLKDLSISTEKQYVIKIGGVSAEGGNISGIRIQDYSKKYAYDTKIFRIYSGTKDLTTENISVGTDTWNNADRYIVDEGADILNLETNKSSFCTQTTPGAYVENVTGDGTIYYMGILYPLAEMAVLYDNGDEVGEAGHFTAKNYGWYEFNFDITLTGFTASHTRVELYINSVVNSVTNGNSVYRGEPSDVSADKIKYSGKITLKLNTGDIVYAGFRVLGSDKTITVVKEYKEDLVWSGRKLQ